MTLFVRSQQRAGRKLDMEVCVSASYCCFVNILHTIQVWLQSPCSAAGTQESVRVYF